MRTRSRNELSFPTQTRTALFASPGTPSTTATLSPVLGSYKTITDVVVPNFRKRVQAGEIFINPLSVYEEQFTTALSGYRHYTNPKSVPPGAQYSDAFTSLLHWKLGPLPNSAGRSNTNPVPWTMSLISRSEADSLQLESATAALADYNSSAVQSLVFLRELQATLDTIRNPLAASLQTISKLRSLGWGSLLAHGTVAKGAANQYLTYLYGLKASMQDIVGILEAMNGTYSERNTFRGASSLERASTASYTLHQGAQLVNSTYKVEVQDRLSVRAGCLGELGGRSFASAFGLNLAAIPGSVYEMLPYSFVVDWFVNLGRYISALSADLQPELRGQWITTKREQKVTRTVTMTQTLSWSRTECSDSDTGVYKTTTRAPTNLADYRGIKFNFTLNRTPALAALSLVVQKLIH